MFDGTPYAYLHICGTPWTGNEYAPGQVPIWTSDMAGNRAFTLKRETTAIKPQQQSFTE